MVLGRLCIITLLTTIANPSAAASFAPDEQTTIVCKASKNLISSSIVSSEGEAKDLFLRLARKLNNGRFKDSEYRFDVKLTNNIWTVYGEDVKSNPFEDKMLGMGGMFMSVEACSGRVIKFRYTR